MAVLGMSDMTAKYVEALIREGDQFDYSKWYRENKSNQCCPGAKGVWVDSAPADVTARLDNGTAKPTASAEPDLVIERRSAATPTSDGLRVSGGDMAQADSNIIGGRSMPPSRPPPPSLAIRRGDLSARQVRDTSTQAIPSELANVRIVWEEFQSGRNREAVYVYLQAVYDLVKDWERRGRVDRKMRRALKARGLKAGPGADPFTVAILCTSDPNKVDNKTRSKWSRVLRYVDSCPPSDEPLRDFVRRKGGINACASRFTRRLGRPRSKPKASAAS